MSASCRHYNGFHKFAQFLRPAHSSLQPASKWFQPKSLHVALIPKAVLSLQPASKVASITKFACGFKSAVLAVLNPAWGTSSLCLRMRLVPIPRMGSKCNLSLFILVTESSRQDLYCSYTWFSEQCYNRTVVRSTSLEISSCICSLIHQLPAVVVLIDII